ncbi:MAG: hypothetical protein RIS24_2940 [Verrucomicrobiota bacterium]
MSVAKRDIAPPIVSTGGLFLRIPQRPSRRLVRRECHDLSQIDVWRILARTTRDSGVTHEPDLTRETEVLRCRISGLVRRGGSVPDSAMTPILLPPEVSRPATVIDRRRFLSATAAAIPLALLGQAAPSLSAAPASGVTSETLAAQLHGSLDEAQRRLLCREFDDPLRQKVDNNWMITGRSIKDALRPDQQDLVGQIFRKLHHPDHAEAMMRQMVEDSEGKGFEGGTSVALFGRPGSGAFELVLTGRHCTRRCDGDSVAGTAFGGPIFYGHQSGPNDEEPADHPGNVFWYQARRANELFQALDGRQRQAALVEGRSRPERATETVRLSGRREGLAGLPCSELSADQKGLMRQVLRDLLAPFRPVDADESMRLVEAQGLGNLNLAYFKAHDLGKDGVWDVWQIEGPHMLWYFRGDPHVHCWVHLRDGKA